uniref:RNA polymerase Rpb4/RPC9 core domain-containing protein n=1 Tax=Strigamia maritima TaxID=126957 RepID=T1JGB7_STRMM
MAFSYVQTQQIEENAAELKFPKEFANAETLLTSEVYKLLDHRKTQHETANQDQELPAVLMKTYSYTQRFSKFKNRETISSVRNMLTNKKFHKFELAQIANLCPQNADEAKCLIPSLERRFEDDEDHLSDILDDVQTKKCYQ